MSSRIRRRSHADRRDVSAGRIAARRRGSAIGRSCRARSPPREPPKHPGLSRHHCMIPALGARFVFAFPHGRLAPTVQTITLPSGAAEHRGIDRLTSRHPHPECSIDRRHQCLRDRPCRVVSANAPTERGRCSGKRRRGRHHHKQRHECGGFRCRGCAINRNATACISQNQWPATVRACARTYAEPAAAECGWSTNRRATRAPQRTPLRSSPVRSAAHHR